MQTKNLMVVHGGISYAGWDFSDLPLGAALAAACLQIDQTADLARRNVLGDPLRALEYERAAKEALTFAAADYVGDMPLSVKAWADAAELDPKAAADSIIAEADDWSKALYAIRAARLMGKQQVLKTNSHDAAEAKADEAINTIQASIVDVGNA